MKKEKLEELIKKCRKMSTQLSKYGEEECAFFDRAANQIEECVSDYLDDNFESEEDVLYNVKELFDEFDNFYEDEE